SAPTVNAFATTTKNGSRSSATSRNTSSGSSRTASVRIATSSTCSHSSTGRRRDRPDGRRASARPRRVQHVAHLARQRLGRKRLLEVRGPRFENAVPHHRVV